MAGATATLTQSERQFKVTSPLGKDVLLFSRMTASERLSGLFEISLDLWSKDEAIDVTKILGAPMGVSIGLPGGGDRYLHGHVADFTYSGHFGELHAYHATLRPWLWFLTRAADCRIFQNQKTPDIIEAVFKDLGFTDCDPRLNAGRYQPWEYCVQYRETSFNFVSRLMEHEGIYYFFKHEQSKHTLVLVDSAHAHATAKGYDKVPYFPPTEAGRRKRDHIMEWTLSSEVQSGKYRHTDFDFTKPSLDLGAERHDPEKTAHAEHEIYDYPGLYVDPQAGATLAHTRMDEMRTHFQIAHGQGDARGIAVGSVFTLEEHPRNDQNQEYLVTSTTIHAASNEYGSGNGAEVDFTCSFTAMPSSQQFRPARVTPKPIVTGPQTAIVVGQAGEEITVDKYGRVKVQFHWDRKGKKDDNSSCWIRVAQLWAGKNWGAMFIPRHEQEVIVDFLEGDPDQPIITGRVYNAENMPPYALPANKTQSTIKSDSSKGHGGSNEMRFEDLKGSEEIYVHAQKDRNLVIEHDETKTVHHDRTKTVDHDQTITIGNDEKTEVKHDRTETVGNNETITIGANRTETVQKDETITINGARTETVAKDETITINGGRTETVAKDETITINGGRTETVAKDESVTISGGRTLSVTKDDSITIGKTLSLAVTDEITITCGSASINMKKNGDITISGANITVKGSSNVVVKGSQIAHN